jgi:hypothetical protein
MKKCFLFFFIFLFILSANSYGVDIKGFQPLDPYGIFSTFSAESLTKGKAAISTGAELSVDPDFYRFVFKTAYGVTDNFEIGMTVPYVLGSGTPDGFEDAALGFKHRFFEEGKYGPSLAYIVTASLPSGRDQLSTNGRYGMGFIVSKRVGPINGHMNLFYFVPGSSQYKKEIDFLAGLDFAAAHNFKLLAELSCKKSSFSSKVDSIEGRIGYRIKTTDYIYTTFGVGYDFKNRSPESRVMFSVTFLSPKEKKKVKEIYEEE